MSGTFITAIVSPAEFVIMTIILSLLLVIVYLLWSLSRSVVELNQRVKRIENEVDDW